MDSPITHGIYGNLPPAVMSGMDAARQLSPLMVGSPALEDLPAASIPTLHIAAPHGTLERRYVFAAALQALSPDGTLHAMAANDKGGQRIKAELEAFGCSVAEASRRHYRVCSTRRPAALLGIEDALEKGAPQIHAAHGLWTQPGIFSWDRVDAGSALLLNHLPQLSGRGADLGCGLGILAASALASPTIHSITLVDVDRRAVAMATRNITDARAAFLWADAREPLALAPLDFVIMNPPFHEAGIEDKSLGQSFIERAAQLLKPGGTCWLTANRHLPYEALLNRWFTRHALIAQADGFKIYMAEK